MKAPDTGWRVREILGEGLRSLRSGGWRVGLLVGAMVTGVALVTYAEVAAVQEVTDLQRALEHAGLGVYVASADEPPDGWACTALADNGAVVSAGGASSKDSVILATAPGSSYRVVEANAATVEIWVHEFFEPHSSLDQPALYPGARTAEELGLGTGGIVSTDAGTYLIPGVLDTEDRNPTISRTFVAIMSPTPTVDECWVSFVRGVPETDARGLIASALSPSNGLAVRPVIAVDEFTRNPMTEFSNRPERNLWLPTGAAVTLLFWMTWWFRRTETGLYRALGMNGGAALLMSQTEVIVIVIVSAVSGFQFGLLASVALGPEPGLPHLETAFRSSVLMALLVLSASALPQLVMGRGGSLATLMKDR